MPVYQFKCQCKIKYDFLTKYDETGRYEQVFCPKCGSKDKEKLISIPYIMGTMSQNNIFDIAAGKNMERAKEERRRAEEASGMTNPFGARDDFHLGEGIHDAEFRSGLS